LRVQATDPDRDTLAFTATGLPPGLNISSLGLISGRVANGARDNSPYTVRVTVTDQQATVNTSFSWIISNAPVVTIASPAAGWHTTPQTFTARVVDAGCDTSPTVSVSPAVLTLTTTRVQVGEYTISAPAADGTYPVTLSVTSGCSGLRTLATRKFGVDENDVTIVFTGLRQTGVDPNNRETWLAVGKTDKILMAALFRDIRSGLASASVTLHDAGNNTQTVLYNETFQRRSGDPPRGDSIKSVAACTNNTHCVNGSLDMDTLQGEFYYAEFTAADVAGRTATKRYYFRVSTLRAAIVAWLNAVRALRSDDGRATASLNNAKTKLERSLLGFDEMYFGNMLLGFEDAYADLLTAKAYDGNISMPPQGAVCGRAASVWMTARLAAARLEFNQLERVATFDAAETFIQTSNRAWDSNDPSAGFLAMANAFFWMADGLDPYVARNFQEAFPLLERLIVSMRAYTDHVPVLPGKAQVLAVLSAVEGTVHPLAERFTNGEQISDIEHVTLFLGLADTAEALKSSENESAWVRNWQWGFTQIIYLFADRDLAVIGQYLGLNHPMYVEGAAQLTSARSYRDNRRADDFMTLLINARCFIIAIFNLTFDGPDTTVPTHCCSEIRRYNGIDNGVPVPQHCVQ
jgi:hypothetical protein